MAVPAIIHFNNIVMEHKKQLIQLNTSALEKLDEYLEAKGDTTEEHKEKISTAKEKWQAAWNEFLETLLVLERLEI
jgi:DNA-binding transcriptional regulator GbsR (MarR family)